jgi:hypothetical protein
VLLPHTSLQKDIPEATEVSNAMILIQSDMRRGAFDPPRVKMSCNSGARRA